jgi:hypothetical protein
MRKPILSERWWKVLLSALLLLFAAICALAIGNWQRTLVQGYASDLDVLCGHAIDGSLPIVSLGAGSSLARAGVKVGDRLVFDDPADSARGSYAPHERVGVTVIQGAARRHLIVEALPITRIDPMQSSIYVIGVAMGVLGLVLGGLIGLRRGSSPSARLLALILLSDAEYAGRFLSTGWLLAFDVAVLGPIVSIVTYCGFFVFACYFPTDERAAAPAWTRKLALPLMSLLAVEETWSSFAAYGWVGTIDVPAGLRTGAVFVLVLLATVNLAQAYRRTAGALRQRVQWVGLATGAKFVVYLIPMIPGVALGGTIGFIWIQATVSMLANIALAYAILRHRVFDIGFVINRALVYGIVSIVLLVSFGLLEWLAHHFISGAGEESDKNVMLDAAIALGLYLGFHRLKHSVDHMVEKLFFHHWHENESRLRRFVRQAMHITSAPDLESAYLAALERFTDNAGAVLYRRRGDAYEQAGGALLQAPGQIGINDALAVALRADHAPLLLHDADSDLPGELALPMSFRGELQGFALVGAKPNRGAYRADEIAALEHATQQVGLDLHALQTEQLQAELAGLRREVSALNQAFERYASGRVA